MTVTWSKAEVRRDRVRGWFVRIDGDKIVEIIPGKGKYWSRRGDLVAVLRARGLRVQSNGWIILPD